jgi:type I restriction enzyme, S subunit
LGFLDRETVMIDSLILEQQRLIELLKEKRQAVISHAVTKGLNPDVPMKVSGVEWIGDVPRHWTVLPIRMVARLESGHTPSRARPEYWENCTVPWFTLADVWQIREARAEYVHETKERISELGLANSAARLLPSGTVLLSRTASVGYSAIMGVGMATTQDFANWVCGPRVLPEYLLYIFRSMSGEFRRLMMGSTHSTIYMPDIQAMRCALPPIEEQATIVAFVRAEAQRFDVLSDEAERAIALLRERRTALISAAVTGKIDVRELAEASDVAA